MPTRRALQRVVLDKNERRIMDAVVDFSFGWGIPALRLNGKRDLEVLTGIAIKNQERTLEALQRMRMLLVIDREDALILEALPDARNWVVTHRIDERVYYRCLAGLREFNALAQLELLRVEKTLNDALGELARSEALDDLVTQGETADTTVEPPRPVLPESDGDPAPEGDNRESSRENKPKLGGPSSATTGPLNIWHMIERGWTPEQVQEAIKAAKGTNQKEGNQGDNPPGQVLTVSTKHPKLPPSTAAKLRPSTHGEYLQGAKPGEEVLTVSTKSTHGKYFEPPINVNDINASSKKHCNNGLMEVAALARENYFERGAGKANLLEYLRIAGVFDGPGGAHFAKFWRDQVKNNSAAVETWFFDLLAKVKEEGPGAVKSPGAFIVDRMKRAGQLRWKRKGNRPNV